MNLFFVWRNLQMKVAVAPVDPGRLQKRMRNMKQAQLAILTRCFGRKGLAWKILWYPIRNLLNRDFLRRSFRHPDVFTLVTEFSLRRYLRLTRTRIVQNPSGKKRLTGKNTEQHRRDS